MAHPALTGLHGVDWVDVRILEELSFLGQERGYSVPSRAYLAQTLGCSIRTVSRHLSKLCDLGYLQRTLRSYRTAEGTIRNRTNLYRVALDVAARIQGFLGTLTQRMKAPFTGRTPLSRDREPKPKYPQKEGRRPPRGGISAPSGAISLPKPETLHKFPLLQTWLERG